LTRDCHYMIKVYITTKVTLYIYIPSNFADVTRSMFSKTGRLE